MQRLRNLEIKSQAIERATLMADGVFDFNRLPGSVIDKGWKRFHPYLLMIDRYHPLMFGYFKKPADIEKLLARVKEVITGTFHINETLFKTLVNSRLPSVALLVPDTDDNVEIIEESFEKLGLYRYKRSSEFILTDPKGRQWVDMRFAAKAKKIKV